MVTLPFNLSFCSFFRGRFSRVDLWRAFVTGGIRENQTTEILCRFPLLRETFSKQVVTRTVSKLRAQSCLWNFMLNKTAAFFLLFLRVPMKIDYRSNNLILFSRAAQSCDIIHVMLVTQYIREIKSFYNFVK